MKLLETKDIKQYEKIIITGHHQGAIVAVLLGYLFHNKNMNNITIYGFGAPHLVAQEVIHYLRQYIKIFFF